MQLFVTFCFRGFQAMVKLSFIVFLLDKLQKIWLVLLG